MQPADATPVVIAGAGYSGSRLAAKLRAAGTSVTTINRRPQAAGQPHICWDPDATQALALPPGKCRAIYLVPPAAGDPEPRLSAFLAALTEPPERVVLASTSGVYGDCAGALIDEEQALQPTSERSARRVVQEATLADWANANNVPTVTLRIAGIYGPGRLPLERLAAGLQVIRADEAHPGNRIHIDDLVTVMAAALSHPDASGAYNVAAGDHDSGTAFYQRVAALADLPAPQEITRAEARATLDARRYSFLKDSRRLDTTRVWTELGIQPQYASMDAGIRAALAASD